MSTAQERLQQGYYNSAAVSGANPGGLASGGHVQNFPAALADIGAVAQTVGTQSAAAVGAAGSAEASALSAHDDRVLAQQAASAAGQFDPTTKVSKSGDTMAGTLSFGSGASYGVTISPASGDRSGTIELWNGPVRTGYIGYSNASANYLVGENGRGWYVSGSFSIGGYAPFTSANDGSGSGLDADLVRGLAPTNNPAPTSVVARDGTGGCGFGYVYIADGGSLIFGSLGSFYQKDVSTLGFDRSLYVGQSVSASQITERSDLRLKCSIEPLEAVDGRLNPVRYVLKETGETRIGFIAQDVVEVRREAVRIGAGEAEQPMLEVSPMALIAHLAAQVNALQDRLEAAGL